MVDKKFHSHKKNIEKKIKENLNTSPSLTQNKG